MWQGTVDVDPRSVEFDVVRHTKAAPQVRVRLVVLFAKKDNGAPRIAAEVAATDAMGAEAWTEVGGQLRAVALEQGVAHMAALCTVAIEAAKGLGNRPELANDENMVALLEAATLTQGRATVAALG